MHLDKDTQSIAVWFAMQSNRILLSVVIGVNDIHVPSACYTIQIDLSVVVYMTLESTHMQCVIT